MKHGKIFILCLICNTKVNLSFNQFKNINQKEVKQMSEIQGQLKDHLNNGQDWEKMETPIDGVNVVKVPATKTRPALLFLEINPLKEDGKPFKRKGLFVGSYEMFVKFGEAFNDDKVYQLIKEVEKVNPKVSASGAAKKLKM